VNALHVLAVALTSACACNTQHSNSTGTCPSEPLTGLVPILADPSSFDGCKVEFNAWLTRSDDGGFCLSESDARIGNFANCITIGTAVDPSLYPPTDAVGRAYHVRGVFNLSKTLLVGSPGTLNKIEEVIDLTDPPNKRTK
jgi:hypothetical protein